MIGFVPSSSWQGWNYVAVGIDPDSDDGVLQRTWAWTGTKRGRPRIFTGLFSVFFGPLVGRHLGHVHACKSLAP